MRIGGARIEIMTRVTRAAFARLTTRALPERLAVRSFRVSSIGAESARVVTYSALDPLDLPNGLVLALPTLNGATPARAIRALEESHAVAVDENELQRLVDFDLLGADERVRTEES